MKQLTPVAIGLGSNLGDRLAVLRQAAEALSDDLLQSARCSSVYDSPPWGYTDQPRFLNAVIVGESEWKPPAIIGYLRDLERRLGRTPSPVKYGPRVLDLDLLAYDEKVWEEPGLAVPHRRLAERDFVLLPLAEVWPDWRDPRSGRSVGELIAALATPVSATVMGPLQAP